MVYSKKLKVIAIIFVLAVIVGMAVFFGKIHRNKSDTSAYIMPGIKFLKDICPGILNIQWVNGPDALPGGMVLQGGIATFKIISTDLNSTSVNRTTKLRIISLFDNGLIQEKSLKAGTTSVEIPIPASAYESEIYADNVQYGANGPTKGQYRAVLTAETLEGSDCNAIASTDFAVLKPVSSQS